MIEIGQWLSGLSIGPFMHRLHIIAVFWDYILIIGPDFETHLFRLREFLNDLVISG